MPWIILILSILFFGFFAKYKKLKVISLVILASIFAIFIVLGSKGMNDFPGYINIYKSISQHEDIYKSGSNFFENQVAYILSAEGGFEPGFLYLNRIFYSIGASPLVFFWTVSFITNFLLIKFIYNFPRPVISILFLICTQLFFQQGNLVRQMLAISILCHSLQFISKNQLSKFLLIIFLATSFHVGSLLFILVYIFYRIEIKKYMLTLMWITSIIIFYFPSIIPLGSMFQVSLFAKDLTLDSNVGDLVHFNFIYNSILLLFLFVKFRDSESNQFKIMLIIFCLGVSIGNIVSVSEWFYRISLYFAAPFIILLSQIDLPISSYIGLKPKEGKLIVLGVTILFLTVYPIRFSFFAKASALGSEWYSVYDFPR
jgi:hypothetical protein